MRMPVVVNPIVGAKLDTRRGEDHGHGAKFNIFGIMFKNSKWLQYKWLTHARAVQKGISGIFPWWLFLITNI